MNGLEVKLTFKSLDILLVTLLNSIVTKSLKLIFIMPGEPTMDLITVGPMMEAVEISMSMLNFCCTGVKTMDDTTLLREDFLE